MRVCFPLVMALLLLLCHSSLPSTARAPEDSKGYRSRHTAGITVQPHAITLSGLVAKTPRLVQTATMNRGSRPGNNSQATGKPESSEGWHRILAEGFEDSFPKTNDWDVYYAPGYQPYFWGMSDYMSFDGTHSAWCAGAHDSGVPDLHPATDDYPDSLRTYMVWGPFDLSSATDATLLFHYWIDCELNYGENWYDWFSWYASKDGEYFAGYRACGQSHDWVDQEFDLTDVYQLGDLTGEPEVWIAYRFVSDWSITSVGVFVDDVELWIEGDQPPSITHTPLDTAQEGSDLTVTVSITDDMGVGRCRSSVSEGW